MLLGKMRRVEVNERVKMMGPQRICDLRGLCNEGLWALARSVEVRELRDFESFGQVSHLRG